MATIEDMIKAEGCFYSVRSDNSMLLVLKVREPFVGEAIWMTIRTDTEKWVNIRSQENSP